MPKISTIADLIEYLEDFPPELPVTNRYGEQLHVEETSESIEFD